MKIQINEHMLESDGRCVTLKIPKPEGTNDNVIGYFPNIHQALCRLLEEKISESAATDAKALIAEIKAFTDKISTPELLKAVNQGPNNAE